MPRDDRAYRCQSCGHSGDWIDFCFGFESLCPSCGSSHLEEIIEETDELVATLPVEQSQEINEGDLEDLEGELDFMEELDGLEQSELHSA